MNGETTDLIFILDRSGSMSGLESETLAGYRSLIEKQKRQEGEVLVTTVLFDDFWEVLHQRVDIQALGPMTEKDYYVRGATALLDAVGRTVTMIRGLQKSPNRTLVAIITDGMENASREYTYGQVRALIELQRTTCDWEFLFLGANIDAVMEGGRLGISASRSADYCADADGTARNFEVLSSAAESLRLHGEIPEDWSEMIGGLETSR